MRNYTLLTGATGLLGTYLLRDLLGNGVPCAVLVRSNRMESASQRIESLLARAESENGIKLLRPVILEGTLSENFGLDAEKTDWVRRHCYRLLHNAASLLFERDPKTDEPYHSNVDGTNHAIEFALNCRIQQFHQVSTAYVCGLRTGICKEDELDVGQKWGNDYEIAKVIAEKNIRSAPFDELPTFYRPAIITGDSVTGYTSTYHGFYTPLKVAAALCREQEFSVSAEDIIHFLDMNGNEHKNFVPVEWISRAIVCLMSNTKNTGKTFHLTPRNRVTINDMQAVFIKSLIHYARLYSRESSPAIVNGASKTTLSPEMKKHQLENFREQMKVYRSYWRDDPVFDTSNTDAALPYLPCPIMTSEILMRLSMFAIESNFGWPKPKPVYPPTFARDLLPVASTCAGKTCMSGTSLPGHVTANNTFPCKAVLALPGPGGGQWTVELQAGRICSIEEGASSDAVGRLILNVDIFKALQQGSFTTRKAIESGSVVWESHSTTADFTLVEQLLSACVTRKDVQNAE